VIQVSPTRGKPSDIEIKKKGDIDATAFKTIGNDSDQAMRDLKQHFVTLAAGKKKGEMPKIEFLFHDDVQYVWAIKMMDDCRLAGHQNVSSGGFRTKP
jgi:hypothetical protein